MAERLFRRMSLSIDGGLWIERVTEFAAKLSRSAPITQLEQSRKFGGPYPVWLVTCSRVM